MKIEVTFGLSLDRAVDQGEDGLGKLRVGPAGLLGFLELHTGLSRKSFSRIERVSAFLGVLNESHTSSHAGDLQLVCRVLNCGSHLVNSAIES